MKRKLEDTVKQLNADSASFWAGRPALSAAELSAIDTYAKNKAHVFGQFLSSKDNISKLEELFQAAIKK